MQKLNDHRDVYDKFESQYVFIVYETTKQQLIDFTTGKINLVKGSPDIVKRNYVLNKLSNFVTYINKIVDDTINSVFLVGKDITNIQLEKQHLKTLKEYNVKKISYKRDDTFDIDFISNLLYNINLRNSIKIFGSDFEHHVINEYKRKLVKQGNISDIHNYLLNISDKCVICGTQKHMSKLKFDSKHIIINDILSDEKILNEFDMSEIRETHKLLQEVFDKYIPTKPHMVKLSSELEANACNIKTIFCSPKKALIVTKYFATNNLKPEIYTIKSLEKGDVGERLKKEYCGVIALTYY